MLERGLTIEEIYRAAVRETEQTYSRPRSESKMREAEAQR
jgi:hypothetical protein